MFFYLNIFLLRMNIHKKNLIIILNFPIIKTISTLNTKHGTCNSEHGTRNVERGTRNAERGTRNTERGTRNAERETRNVKRGTRNAERGTRNAEHGTRKLIYLFFKQINSRSKIIRSNKIFGNSGILKLEKGIKTDELLYSLF